MLSKIPSKTWLEVYAMKKKASKSLVGQEGKTSFEVAHVRKHSNYIEHAEIFDRLVVSFDCDGILNFTLISFEDPEEFETRTITEFSAHNILKIHYIES